MLRLTRSMTLMISTAILALAAPASAEPGSSPGHALVAEQGPALEVVLTVVHAKAEEGGVAPELEPISRYLLKSFPGYKSFKRLSSRDDKLAVNGEIKETLPNRSELVYRHLGWKDGFAAIALEVGGLKTTVNVKDGGTFFQAGRGHEGGMIVLAFQVKAAR